MLQISDKLLELLRNQVPYAGTDLPSNPMVTFLQGLVEKVNQLDAQVPRVLDVIIDFPVSEVDEIAINSTLDLGVSVVTQAGASETVTWSLENIVYPEGESTGVSIDEDTGVITVADDANIVGTTFDAVVTSGFNFDGPVTASTSFTVVAE